MTRKAQPKLDPERVRIGATVRELRESRGVRAGELAIAVGISHPYLSNIEAGRKPLTPALLSRISSVLNVRPISIVRADFFPADDEAVSA